MEEVLHINPEHAPTDPAERQNVKHSFQVPHPRGPTLRTVNYLWRSWRPPRAFSGAFLSNHHWTFFCQREQHINEQDIKEQHINEQHINQQHIKDPFGRIMGRIRRTSTGQLEGRDSSGRILGRYGPESDLTRDQNGRIVAKGNVLSGLILQCEALK